MSKRKLNPREGKLGRFVSPKYAETHKAETTVQTITISEAKYKEAEEMLEKLETQIDIPTPQEFGIYEVLRWLIKDGKKPVIQ